MFLKFNSHDQHRLEYAHYFLQSHAEVPKLALEELIEVLKPLNLKNRDKIDEGVSLQHRFITNYLFKASLDISMQHCVLNCTHTGSHGNMHIFYIQSSTERLHELYHFTPKKYKCRLLNLKQKMSSENILQKKHNVMLEPLISLMNFFPI